MRSRKGLVSFGALAIALVLAVAACGGGGKDKSKDKTPASTSSTTKPKPAVAPLTGLPDPTGQSKTRAALTVKVDNTQKEGAKAGVEHADVIYEEIVEGGITRLAAIFNSNAPAKIGPIRSVRKTDQSIVWPIGGLFAYSGGARYAIESIDTAPVKQIDETRAGDAMFRDHSRRAPYNLFGDGPKLFAEGGTPKPPPPLFVYRAAGTPVVGEPASAFRVEFKNGFATTWNWDAATGAYKRSIFGRPETTVDGVQLAAPNVVVMFVDYIGGAGALQAEANLVGQGDAWIFTGGKVVKARWSRPDKAKPAKLLDALGKEIALTPGQTWVELPQIGYAVPVTP